jgi:plasmid stabilization system protein ParE
MVFNLIIKEEAAAEINEAYFYYEKQNEGLGQRFIDELDFHLAQITQAPHHYSFYLHQKRFRSYSLEKFPYSIIYEVIDNDIVIYAVHNFIKTNNSYLKDYTNNYVITTTPPHPSPISSYQKSSS